jgi:hypothetical protein
MSTQCIYCSESIPFYQQIIAAQRANVSLRTAAIFPNTTDEVAQYAQQKQLNTQFIAGIDLSSINVSGTPTLILVDRNGKILNFWVGRLSEKGEQEVINATNIAKRQAKI